MISGEDHARFCREGLLVLPGQFDSAELMALTQALDRLRARAENMTVTAVQGGAQFVMKDTGDLGTPSVQRVVWCGAAETVLAALGQDPRILNRAAALLGTSTVDQLINQAHFKEPGDGVDFPLHQDAWNRRYGTDLWNDSFSDGSYVQVLLTVDSMTEENGPLLYVPGSHRLGPLLGADRRAQIDALVARTAPRPVIAEPGTLVFFGPFLIHGSSPNRSASPRRVVINGFARPGVNRRRYHGAGMGVRRQVGLADPSTGPAEAHPWPGSAVA